MSSLIINPFAPYTEPAKQEPAHSEKRAEKKAKRTKAEQSRIWAPGNDPLAMSLKSFATSHPNIWKIAQDLALFCADALILDPSQKIPIAIDVAGEGEDVFFLLRISLAHDLYGRGILKVLSEEEYEISFWSRIAPPKAILSSKNKTKKYITDTLCERNESLQIIRGLLEVETMEEVMEDKIQRELNYMLEKYHEATDQAACELMEWMDANGVKYSPPKGAVILVNAPAHRDFSLAITGARNLLLTTEFSHFTTATREELMTKIGEYLVLEQFNTNYLYTALQELTSVGIKVIANRSVSGDAASGFKNDPEEYVIRVEDNGNVHLPLLPYVTEFVVEKP